MPSISRLLLLSGLFIAACTNLVACSDSKTTSVVTPAVDQGLLKARARFAKLESDALARPFLGVTTHGEQQRGLFTVKKTGISTQPIVAAATHFLTTLTTEQRQAIQHSVDDKEWRKWSNVDNGIYIRAGISLKAMSATQRKALFELLQNSLSVSGMEKVRKVMQTDYTLREFNPDNQFLDESLYYITLMGEPSSRAPWGWQFEGHHLAINYFVLGDQVVMTPVFMGAEPAITTSGKYAGNDVLQAEQDLGLALMQSFSKQQQAKAIVDEKGRTNMLAAANQDNLVLPYVGLSASEMTPSQQQQLLGLMEEYISNMRNGHAQIRMEEIKQHLANTHFSWAGGTSPTSAFYYRVHSPVVLIEFDHQGPVALPGYKRGKPIKAHIHTVIRTPNGNDYGKDLLRQHLLQHHSHAHQHESHQ